MRAIPLFLFAATISPLSLGAQAKVHEPHVLAIFAHPDDEVTVGPVLARSARDGSRVQIVYATSGDRGTAFSGLEAGDELARLREGEARCASAALGIEEPAYLRLGDATLGIRAHDTESPALRFLEGVRRLLAETKPDIVITWGPDGGYGHADHRMVSALVTQAVQELEESRPRLLYPGIRNGTLPPIPELQMWATTDPVLLDVDQAYEAQDLSAAHAAVGCHVSQFDEATRAGLAPLFDQSIWQGAVHFREALKPPAGPGD